MNFDNYLGNNIVSRVRDSTFSQFYCHMNSSIKLSCKKKKNYILCMYAGTANVTLLLTGSTCC